MLGATLYIVACSARNRARRWLRRVREPRYFIGAVAGVFYFSLLWLSRGRTTGGAGRGGHVPAALMPAMGPLGPALGGLALLVMGGLTWLLPVRSALFEFTEAETAFLMPAPISRRQLLLYRVLRAQWAVLLGAAIFAVTYPVASASARVRGLIGGWLLLMTCHVFFTGVTLARTHLDAHDARRRWVARAPLFAMLAILGIVFAPLGLALWRQPIETADEVITIAGDIALNGWPHLALRPFIAVAGPLFATSFTAFGAALVPAALVYVLLIAWVLSMDGAFESIASENAEKQGLKKTTGRVVYTARPAAWELAESGRVEMAFVWKAALQTFRIVDRRMVVRLAVLVAWLTVTGAAVSRARGLAQVLGAFAAFAALFATVMMPQVLRLDFRQDLRHLELLKTWPVRAGTVVRGELLWPVAVTTSLAWSLGGVALILSASAFSRANLSWRLAIGLSAMIAMPALIAAQYTIHNAVALIFPAWVPLSGKRPRGLDAMGQRMLLLSATWLTLALAVLPGVILGGVLWLLFFPVVGPWILVPSAMIGTAIVTIEVWIATEALGPAYERLDLSSVERGE